MKNLKKYKNVSGGMLLEIILMLAVMMSIFPIMQRNIKKRTDNIRNQMVIKDMLKLKGAVENYLKKQPNLKEGVNDIDLNVLVENGLSAAFKKQNVLNQIYKVRVKVKKEQDLDVELLMYDAIIIATGNDEISPMRIRDIVKEAKGYAGYVEKDMVYGPSWQFKTNVWKKDNTAMDINEHSLVLKTGLTKDDDKYIYRVPNSGSASMRTDLYMGFNNIIGINNIFINGGVDTTNAEFRGQTNLRTMAVENILDFNNTNIKVNEIFNFIGKKDTDINFENYDYVDNSALFVYLANVFTAQELLFNDSAKKVIGSYDQLLRSLISPIINFNSNSTIINKISKFLIEQTSDVSKDVILKLKELDTRTFNIKSKNNADSFASVEEVASLKEASKYFIIKDKFSAHDIIVKNVNKKIIYDLGLKKLGGIDITEKTPLSVVLRGIHYSYCDMYKLVHNQYPTNDGIVPGWYCNLYRRCEYAECEGQWYY